MRWRVAGSIDEIFMTCSLGDRPSRELRTTQTSSIDFAFSD
jgi:hypothetical protein